MKKLTLAIAAAALLAGSAFAQTSAPGEDKAAPAKSATATEKNAANSARKTEGTMAAKSAKADDDVSSKGTAKSTSKSERKSASAKRKDEGTKATKEPKDMSGPKS